MIQPVPPKGRLESLMDDFTEVHGTVLLGMHRELQTIRTDVEERITEQLETRIQEINSQIRQQIEHANAVFDKSLAESKKYLLAIETLGTRVREELQIEQSAGAANLTQLITELEEGRATFRHSLQSSLDDAIEQISSLRASCLDEVHSTLKAIESNRSQLDAEAVLAEKRIGGIKSEMQSKLNASLSYASKMNGESQKLLKKVRERQELLYQRELRLHKRTKQFVAGVAITVLATVLVWIWLALNH